MSWSPERIEIHGFVHIIHRGVGRGLLFLDDADRRHFLQCVVSACESLGWSVVAWALMSNHVHIVARRSRASTAVFVRTFTAAYARRFNHRHCRSGHVVEGRYRRIRIKSEAQLLACIRYVHLNPVVAGIVPDIDALDSYLWTGHRALMGATALPCHDVDLALSLFGDAPESARSRMRRFLLTEMEIERERWGDIPP